MAEFREIIQKNYTTLCDLTKGTDRFLDRCCEENIITSNDKEKLDAKPEGYGRNRAFYDMVFKNDTERFLKLIEIMGEEDTRQSTDVLSILNRSNPYNNVPGSSKELQKLHEKRKHSESKIRNIWFDVGEPVTSFVGREKDLEKLHKYVMRNSEKDISSVTVISQLTSVSGLGGIGKTTLARKYARSYANYFDQNVIWINAETSSSMQESFTRLAEEIGVHVKSEKIQITRDKIYKSLETRKCLFIFDNVESYDGKYGVQEYLPRNPGVNANKPYILMTSRNWRILQTCKVLELGVLTEEESISFVKQQLEFENEDEFNVELMQKLVKKLEYLPLALQQAVAYIRNLQQELELSGETIDPIEEYLRLLEEDSTSIHLLGYEFAQETGDDYEFTVLSTWNITISKIKSLELGELALVFMKLIAYFEPDDIRCSTFLNVIEKRKIESATNVLKKYSMIEKSRGVISVHRLVQHVIRIQNKHEESNLLRVCLEKIVPEELPLSGKFRQHIASIWKYSLGYPDLISNFSKVGLMLSDAFSHEEMYNIYLTYNDTELYGLELLAQHMKKYHYKFGREYRTKITKELETLVPSIVSGWKNSIQKGMLTDLNIKRLEHLAHNIEGFPGYTTELYKSALEIHQIVSEYHTLEKSLIEKEYQMLMIKQLEGMELQDKHAAVLNEVLYLTSYSDENKVRFEALLTFAINKVVMGLESAVLSPSIRPVLVEQVNLLIKGNSILKEKLGISNLEEHMLTLIILIHRLVVLGDRYEDLLKYSKDLCNTSMLFYKSYKKSYNITVAKIDFLFEFLIASFSARFGDQNRSTSMVMLEICISIWKSTFDCSMQKNNSKKLIEFVLNATQVGVDGIRLVRTQGFPVLSVKNKYFWQIHKLNSLAFQLIETGTGRGIDVGNRDLFLEESLQICESIFRIIGPDSSSGIGMILSFILNHVNFISASLELNQMEDVLKYSVQLYSFLCTTNKQCNRVKNKSRDLSIDFAYYSGDYFTKLEKLATTLLFKVNQANSQIEIPTNNLKSAAIKICECTWVYFRNPLLKCSFNFEAIVKCYVLFAKVDEMCTLSKAIQNHGCNVFYFDDAMLTINLTYNLIKFGKNSDIENYSFEEARKLYTHYLKFKISTITAQLNELLCITMELKVSGALQCLRIICLDSYLHQHMPNSSKLEQLLDALLEQSRNEEEPLKKEELINNIISTLYRVYADYYLVNIKKCVSWTAFDSKPFVKCYIELEDFEGMKQLSIVLQTMHPAARENEQLHWIVLKTFASTLRDQVSGMQNFKFREEFLREAESISELVESNGKS